MKLFFFITLIFVFGVSTAQIREIVIRDKTFLKGVDMILDSINHSENDLGVVTIEISDLNYSESREEVLDKKFGTAFKINENTSYQIKASLELNIIHFQFSVPSFYFKRGRRMILVYTGVERFIEPSIKDIKDLQRKIRDFLPKNGTFLSPTYWIRVDGNDILFERKGKS